MGSRQVINSMSPFSFRTKDDDSTRRVYVCWQEEKETHSEAVAYHPLRPDIPGRVKTYCAFLRRGNFIGKHSIRETLENLSGRHSHGVLRVSCKGDLSLAFFSR